MAYPSLEYFSNLWDEQQAAPSLDVPRQQDTPSNQWLKPNLADYYEPSPSHSPLIDFASAHQPGFQSQPAPYTNDSKHSFEPPAQTPPYNPQYQSEEDHPTESPFSMEPMPPRNVVHARTQRSANGESRSDSSSSGYASPASAAVIAPRSTNAVFTPEIGELRFESYESACATVDPMFRDSVNVKANHDDVLEVEQNPKHHVQLLVDALNHDGYMEEDVFRKTMTIAKKPSTAFRKQVWDEWQEESLAVVKAHFKMPNVGARVEWIAWAILEEILKVHREGFRYTTLTADRKSKCSQRVVLAAKAMKTIVLARQRILEGCDLSDIAAGPLAYAKGMATTHRNNSIRKVKAWALAQANGGGNLGSGNARRAAKERSAVAMGAIAKRYMSRASSQRVGRELKNQQGEGDEDDVDDEGDDDGGDGEDEEDEEDEETDTSTADIQRPQRPAVPLTSGPSEQRPLSSLPQLTQSAAHRMINTSRPNTGVFGGNANSAMQFAPHGASNHGMRNVASQSRGYGMSNVPSLNEPVGYHGDLTAASGVRSSRGSTLFYEILPKTTVPVEKQPHRPVST